MQHIGLSSEKPPYVLFLDVDGVILSHQVASIKNHDTKALAKADSYHAFLSLNTNSYSNNYWSIVYTSYFSKKALTHLEELL